MRTHSTWDGVEPVKSNEDPEFIELLGDDLRTCPTGKARKLEKLNWRQSPGSGEYHKIGRIEVSRHEHHRIDGRGYRNNQLSQKENPTKYKR